MTRMRTRLSKGSESTSASLGRGAIILASVLVLLRLDAAEFRGRAIDERGAGTAVTVCLVRERSPSFGRIEAQVLTGVSDDDGAFSFDTEPGFYALFVSKGGFLPIARRIHVRNESTAPIRVRMRPTGGVGSPPGAVRYHVLELTVCEALENAAEYDGEMVRIRADLVFGVDYAGISGGHCKLSKEALWGLEPAIFPARYGARFVGDPRAPVDSESLLRFDIETESVRKRDPMATHRMTVTLTGRFEGRAVTDPRDLTPAKLIGFGARGEMRAQLVITAVSDINFVGNISAGGREP